MHSDPGQKRADELEPFRGQLHEISHHVAIALERTQLKIVFAESCTAGRLSAGLSQFAGISQFLCGSLVTYRNASKVQWLKVNQLDLEAAEIGPVSEAVAGQMAQGALACTPEADLAVSITGHLGPGAPPHLDGIAYSACLLRSSATLQIVRWRLTGESCGNSLRDARQLDASIRVMQHTLDILNSLSSQTSNAEF